MTYPVSEEEPVCQSDLGQDARRIVVVMEWMRAC